MILNASLAKSLLMAAAVGMVTPVHTRLRAESAEQEESREVPGVKVARAKGGFLALAVENGVWVARFLDETKKEATPDASAVVVRWNPVGTVTEQRAFLKPTGEGSAMSGSTRVRPPLNFKAYVTLLGPEEQALESLVVDVRGLAGSSE